MVGGDVLLGVGEDRLPICGIVPMVQGRFCRCYGRCQANEAQAIAKVINESPMPVPGATEHENLVGSV